MAQVNMIFASFIILCLPCLVMSPTPELSLSTTNDIKFRCSLEGFNKSVDYLYSLQIIKMPDKQKNGSTVATLVGSSCRVTERWKKISGLQAQANCSTFDSKSGKDAWLEVMFSITSPWQWYGEYLCQIRYSEHNKDPISLRNVSVDVQKCGFERPEVPGFRVKLMRVISFKGVIDTANVSSVSITNDTHRLLSYSKEGKKCMLKYRISPDIVNNSCEITESQVKLQARMQVVTCTHQSNYVLNVDTDSGKILKSQPQKSTLKDCCPVPESNIELAHWLIPVCVILIIIVGAVCYYKRKKKCCFEETSNEAQQARNSQAFSRYLLSFRKCGEGQDDSEDESMDISGSNNQDSIQTRNSPPQVDDQAFGIGFRNVESSSANFNLRRSVLFQMSDDSYTDNEILKYRNP